MLHTSSAWAHVRKGFVITAAAAAVLVTGCATPSRVALSPDLSTKIGSTQTIVGITKAEIGSDIQRSTAGTGAAATGGLIGGLVGGIIDSSVNNSRAKSAEAAIAPLRDALVKYDVGKNFSEALQSHFVDVSWLKNGSVESRRMHQDSLAGDWIKASKADTVFILKTDYRASHTFDSVNIVTTIYCYLKNASLNSSANATDGLPPLVYFNTLCSSVPISGLYQTGKSKEEAIKFAVADGGKTVIASIDQGLDELARMLVFDLDQKAPPNNNLYKAGDKEESRVVPSPHPEQGVVIEGYVVHRDDKRVWVRLPGGELVAAP